MEYTVIRLTDDDIHLVHPLLDCFGKEFDDAQTYCRHRPTHEYLLSLLSRKSFIALAALNEEVLVGGLVAYELQKLEQQRSEVYIYDLAVSSEHRRKGVATALIECLSQVAKDLGAWVVYVQADYEDQAAVNLYTRLGEREDVMHFDLPID